MTCVCQESDHAALAAVVLRRRAEASAAEKEDQEEEQEEEEVWTWDVENCGPTVQVQGLGLTAVLKEDAERSSAPVVWETRDDDDDEWVPMPTDVQEEVERKFRSAPCTSGSVCAGGSVLTCSTGCRKGDLYNGSNFLIKKGSFSRALYLFFEEGELVIRQTVIEGMSCEWRDGSRNVGACRRRGERCFVKGEDQYLSKEQRDLDGGSRTYFVCSSPLCFYFVHVVGSNSRSASQRA